MTALAALLDGRVCAASAEGVRVWDANTGACHALLAPAPAATGGQEMAAAWALDVLERRHHAASGR